MKDLYLTHKVIGYEFQPNHIGNSEIDLLLGYESVTTNNTAVRMTKTACISTPNYVDDQNLTSAILASLDVKPEVIALGKNYIAVFSYKNESYKTLLYQTESQALACVLWYVLAFLTRY